MKKAYVCSEAPSIKTRIETNKGVVFRVKIIEFGSSFH